MPLTQFISEGLIGHFVTENESKLMTFESLFELQIRHQIDLFLTRD